jgi:hypothetical protein
MVQQRESHIIVVRKNITITAGILGQASMAIKLITKDRDGWNKGAPRLSMEVRRITSLEKEKRWREMMDSRKERCAGEEDNETNLGVKAEFAGDEKRGRKSSPNFRQKFAGTQAVDEKLRRDVERATSGTSR